MNVSRTSFSNLLSSFEKALLANGANVDAADGYGWTALLESARRSHSQIVEVSA